MHSNTVLKRMEEKVKKMEELDQKLDVKNAKMKKFLSELKRKRGEVPKTPEGGFMSSQMSVRKEPLLTVASGSFSGSSFKAPSRVYSAASSGRESCQAQSPLFLPSSNSQRPNEKPYPTGFGLKKHPQITRL